LRRPDLTVFDRLQIVFDAYCSKIFNIWGTITELARFHDVSRTFIYNQLARFEIIVESALGTPAIVENDDTQKKRTLLS